MKNLCISSKGQAIVLIALTIVVLLAIAGLALDVGMAYGVKSKLNAAVDVAAIAAARVISQGSDAANTQAAKFFDANYPSGLLGSTVTAPVTNAVHNADGSWTITVTATASVPTNFAKVVGWPSFSVNASATSSIRTLDLILVLDSSGSLHSPSNTPDLLRSAAKGFIKSFDQTSDRVGLIHFASGAVSDVTITASKGFNPTDINGAIDKITVTGATTSEEAMRMAQAQLDAVPADSRSSLRAIVLFTDGAPNGVAGNFIDGGSSVKGALYSEIDQHYDSHCNSSNTAINMYSINLQDNYFGKYCNITTLPATDYTGMVNLKSDLSPHTRILDTTPGGDITNTRCNVNKAARNMLENVANAARSEAGNPIHVFTIGLGHSLTTQEITDCGYGSNESGENILRRLANIKGVDTYNQTQPSGLYAFAADATQLNSAFQQVANQILRLSK